MVSLRLARVDIVVSLYNSFHKFDCLKLTFVRESCFAPMYFSMSARTIRTQARMSGLNDLGLLSMKIHNGKFNINVLLGKSKHNVKN